MRNRMKQLARGKFDYDLSEISFSQESLSLTVVEGEDYSGSFSLTNKAGNRLRGVCYSTNPRMECLTPQFDSDEVRIRYQLHSKGLIDGEVLKGEFVIVLGGRECSLPFVVSISRNFMDSSIGFIKNLYDFSCLAKEHWNEAYQLFYHRNFADIIKPNEVKEAMIYRGITAAKPSNRNMEEFLVAIGKKNRVTFSCQRSEITVANLKESQRETIEISKDGWGFTEISVSSDSVFLDIPKKKINSDDFIGSTSTLEFYIRQDKLHAGKNIGRLYLKSAYQEVEIPVTVCETFDSETMELRNRRRDIKENMIGIVELYVAYRLKRLVTGVWANETINILDHLHEVEPDETMYLLMKAQALLINRQRQECEWILEDFKRDWVDRKSPVYAYYLYICSLMEREPVYVDRMTEEIKLIFRENPDSVLCFWILTFLDEDYYNNNSLKLKAIEYWVNKGCTSPYLYLEAYYLFWQDPYLLAKMSGFEKRVLRWAVRHKAMNKDIAGQIFQILSYSVDFDPVCFELLAAAYEADPRPENAAIIVSYLIHGNQFDNAYHSWYEKGIELELRITGLYEAYLVSMDERRISELPRMIRMYFQYDNNLPYRKLAVLYNNIIAAKDTDPDTYNQYRKIMGRFAMEQVEAEHMDDNLAVLYGDMLDLGFVNEELAHDLAHLIFRNKLIVFENNMVRAVIYQRELANPQIVPIRDNVAYFDLYSKEYVILFEDQYGHRFAGSVSYRLEPLMNPDIYLEKCMQLASDELSFTVHRFLGRKNFLTFSKDDGPFFKRILFGEEFSVNYRSQMIPEILRYYTTVEYDSIAKEFLESVDIHDLDAIARKYLMEMFVENHLYERALDSCMEFGSDQIGAAYQAALADHLIVEQNYEEDDFLMNLCQQIFYEGKYTNLVLDYLCRHYTGPSGVMLQLWKAARSYEIDTFDLEEKILTQLMYSDKLDYSTSGLFAHYYESGGRELIVLAYITYMSHQYFVNEKELTGDVLDLLRGRYEKGMELNDACRLALLKKLSEKAEVSEEELEIEDELLSEYTNRNMNFAFYKKLDKRLTSKYHFYDKVFLEYRTSPLSHVVLNYSFGDNPDFVTEDMTDVYDGIFVKSFVMFFGERIRYYVSEENGSNVNVSASSEILNNDVYGEDSDSRYNLLNQMMISDTLREEENLLRAMKRYYGFEKVSKDAFRIL